MKKKTLDSNTEVEFQCVWIFSTWDIYNVILWSYTSEIHFSCLPATKLIILVQLQGGGRLIILTFFLSTHILTLTNHHDAPPEGVGCQNLGISGLSPMLWSLHPSPFFLSYCKEETLGCCIGAFSLMQDQAPLHSLSCTSLSTYHFKCNSFCTWNMQNQALKWHMTRVIHPLLKPILFTEWLSSMGCPLIWMVQQDIPDDSDSPLPCTLCSCF